MTKPTTRRSTVLTLQLPGLSAVDCRELATVLVRLSFARATFTARGCDALARAADQLLARAAAQPARARRPGPGPATPATTPATTSRQQPSQRRQTPALTRGGRGAGS